MNMKPTTALSILALSIVLNSCCMFKEGSWAPLPSCENAEKHAAMKKANLPNENAGQPEENKSGGDES